MKHPIHWKCTGAALATHIEHREVGPCLVSPPRGIADCVVCGDMFRVDKDGDPCCDGCGEGTQMIPGYVLRSWLNEFLRAKERP